MSDRVFNGFFTNDQPRAETTEFDSPFALAIPREDFVRFKTVELYIKILTLCYDYCSPITKEDVEKSLFDSAEASMPQHGLISRLAWAMMEKSILYLVYDGGLVRNATTKERKQIEEDYEKNGKSDVGILVNFKKFTKTDLIKFYMAQVYGVQAANNSQMGVASALQFKIKDLRKIISRKELPSVINQIKEVVKGMLKGKPVYYDSEDTTELPKVDTTASQASSDSIYAELSAFFGYPISFFNGKLTSGMSVVGDADLSMIEKGTKIFFNTIFKPVADKLYGIEVHFVSQMWRAITSYSGALIAVENSDLLSKYEKRMFANRLLNMEVTDKEKVEMDKEKEDIPILADKPKPTPAPVLYTRLNPSENGGNAEPSGGGAI